MLKNNLKVLMAVNNIDSISDLMKISNLSRNAINRVYHNENIEVVNLSTLISLCETLQVRLSELIEYVPKDLEDEITREDIDKLMELKGYVKEYIKKTSD